MEFYVVYCVWESSFFPWKVFISTTVNGNQVELPLGVYYPVYSTWESSKDLEFPSFGSGIEDLEADIHFPVLPWRCVTKVDYYWRVLFRSI